jgi:hypothetical protein
MYARVVEIQYEMEISIYDLLILICTHFHSQDTFVVSRIQ